jgi:hypothetical protein
VRESSPRMSSAMMGWGCVAATSFIPADYSPEPSSRAAGAAFRSNS